MKNNIYKNYTSIFNIIKRHFASAYPYLTIYKIYNIVLSFISLKLGLVKLRSKPFFIKIEPTSKCNLRCHGCLHAQGRTEMIDNGYIGDMDFNIFKKIIDELKKELVKVSLYIEGEPLIYNKIAEMVKYLNDNKIASVISSNLNYLPEELAHSLVKNKLTHLIVSFDGHNEESYQKYRVGGKLERVIENIKLIQAEKEKQNSKYPLLEIQTINFDYFSEEDLEKIKEIANDLGADIFSLKENVVSSYEKPNPKKKKCFWLYMSPAIKWNGIMQPCCYFYDNEDNNFGDVKNNSIGEIWNNEKFRQARAYFANKDINQGLNIKCTSCIFFKR